MPDAPLDVEIIGAEGLHEGPSREQITRLSLHAAASAGITRGHLAIEFVDPDRITALNREHRGLDEPTDVLSFPIDGAAGVAGAMGDPDDQVPLELGDVIICPSHTRDLREAIVHGVLHLVGMDHERDEGEMLALQAQLLAREEP